MVPVLPSTATADAPAHLLLFLYAEMAKRTTGNGSYDTSHTIDRIVADARGDKEKSERVRGASHHTAFMLVDILHGQ